jgi:hypothetical protein
MLGRRTENRNGQVRIGKAEIAMNVIGVDLGRESVLALLSPAGELVDVADMPVLRDGPASRRAVNPALLAAIIRKW